MTSFTFPFLYAMWQERANNTRKKYLAEEDCQPLPPEVHASSEKVDATYMTLKDQDVAPTLTPNTQSFFFKSLPCPSSLIHYHSWKYLSVI